VDGLTGEAAVSAVSGMLFEQFAGDAVGPAETVL
jgi:hypothetical protein